MGKNIGIDFGTTNTLVSFINRKGKVVNFRTNDGEKIIPSAVFFRSKNKDEWIIGDEAKQEILLDPRAGVENFKSLLGKTDYFYSIIAENGDEFEISPREVTCFFIEEVLRLVEEYFDEEFEGDDSFIESVVVSVPAKFNYIERGAIKKAVDDANINGKVKIVTESTAAAYAHVNLVEYENKPDTVLVYDFGGGTFDVSLLKIMKNGTYSEAVVPGGDKNLGGNKLTRRIAEKIIETIEEEYEYCIPLLDIDETYNENKYGMTKKTYLKNLREIFKVSDSIKELSSKGSDYLNEKTYVVNLGLDSGDCEEIELNYTKKAVDELICDDIDRTIAITLNMLKEVNDLSINEINSVVIAGGSSNITMVKEKLEDALKMEITRADDVMTLISRGAALFAQESVESELGIISQTNTEIGIKAKVKNIPNAFKKIIPCGMNLPTGKITEEFSLAFDGQREISIEIYERDIKNYPDAKKTNSEGVTWVDKFDIKDLPENLNKDEVRIEVSFEVDEEGTMDVKVILKDINGYVIDNTDITVTVESNLR